MMMFKTILLLQNLEVFEKLGGNNPGIYWRDLRDVNVHYGPFKDSHAAMKHHADVFKQRKTLEMDEKIRELFNEPQTVNNLIEVDFINRRRLS